VAHIPELIKTTRCSEKEHAESLLEGLPASISDSDLDQDGSYTFEKVLRLSSPKDLSQVSKSHGATTTPGLQSEALAKAVDIKLSNNFDVSASVEFEFDLALFTLRLV